MGFWRRLLGWLRGDSGTSLPTGANLEPGWTSVPAGRDTPSTTPPNLPPPESDPYFAPSAAPASVEPVGTDIKIKTLGLDAGAFLPITRAEIKEAAKGQDLFANPWFGLRDRIPPADDPRTLLIDRAMVTQGLLAPEQLAEIHQVGDLMEQVRPSLAAIEHKATLVGQEAVEAERAARAVQKAQKKAEAVERKRLRAEAIAHRRATDIIFLGRGVSGRLNDRTSDISALQTAGLPVLSTPADLAAALDLSIPRLRWLAFHAEVATRVHYIRFDVPKRGGGTRALFAPHRSLDGAQRWIFENILNKLPVDPAAQGFVPGRSTLTNAQAHAGKHLVLNLDLRDFFPSIVWPRVRAVFQRAGYSPAVATILALLCTECPRKTVIYDGTTYHVATGPRGLPQGACTSPALSNQVARRLDRRLTGLASKLGLTYTRYADDLTISGDAALADRIGYVLARVRHLAADEGFAVNETKTRVLGRNARQSVTGLVVNDRPGVPRAVVRRLRAILHRARHEGLASQNRAGHPDFRAWIQGMIAYVSMARPETGARLRAALEAVPE
jgi:RNA-directed DNA polymerase